jgi:EAL domain-containing protein (putative c-di-GMP-specific phosphodiesterase class I)/CHASE2 domain-containing sensor protein/GGDEF domain-containing protein
MLSHRDWSRRPLSLLLALLVAVSAAFFAVAGIFDPVEDALTTHRAELLTRKPTGETAIVEIDARSLAELRSWPWPRRYHAEVVRQLHKSGASVIAFDVDFSAQSNQGDEQLSAAISEAGHVILPIFAQKASGGDDSRILSSRPDAAFRSAWVGGVNIFPDPDGVVREYPAATFIDGAVQPSIATLLAEKNGLRDRTFQPDWAIEASAIPRFSFADVMKGRVPANALNGKRVLIGATAIELGDRYAVPRYGVVPGVVVQALAAETLLQDRAVQRTGFAVTLAGIFVIALLLAPRPIGRPVRYAMLSAGILAALVAAPVIAQRLWPVSVDSAAWVFTLFAAIAVQAVMEARRRLRLRAQIDADSGLPNRSVLEKTLAAEGALAPDVITAAIERFEEIRDGIGLAATNEMIRKCADLVGGLTGTVVHRIAPDVIAWAQPHDDHAVQSVLHKIQSALREPVGTAAGPVDVALTLGLERSEDSSAAVLRIERALAAVSTARSLGKTHDWYRAADPQGRRQLSMMSELRRAMDQGRLRMAYQPKMTLATDAITDVEALIRWRDDDGTIVSPDEFIPLAEATGVIREVTIFALRTAMADLNRWAQQGVAMRVAVNVSAIDLATEDFADEVDRILGEAGVPPSQLTLEVTESALIRSRAEAIATLTKLRERGIRLAVDDYGTGQSTLSYLKHLPVHEVKIDKSFVTALANDESDAILVRSSINLAHELGLQVVAEGIEDQPTLDVLRKLGCDYAQGYFISKPIPADELLALASRATRGLRAA